MMKPIRLQLQIPGKTTQTLDLTAEQQIRLQAFAEANKLTLVGMVDLAIHSAIDPDDETPSFAYPAEKQIVKVAAKLLAEA